MSYEELNEFQDQAKRPDLRFLASLSLMIIGLLLSYFTSSSPREIRPSEVPLTAESIGQPKPSDIKSNIIRDPEFIKSLHADDITDLFGAPDFLRGEGKFLMWHYKSDECVLEMYWEDKNENGLIPKDIILRERLSTESKCIESLF